MYYIMYCALLPGSGYRPTRIRIYISRRGCGGVGEHHRSTRKIRWELVLARNFSISCITGHYGWDALPSNI